MADTTTTLSVRGMSCGNCVKHVEEAVRSVRGVAGVKVDLASGEVKVTHAPGTDVEAMIQAIDEAGYEAGVGATARA